MLKRENEQQASVARKRQVSLDTAKKWATHHGYPRLDLLFGTVLRRTASVTARIPSRNGFLAFSYTLQRRHSSAYRLALRWRCAYVIYGGDVRWRERPLAEFAEHHKSDGWSEKESRVVPRWELRLWAPSTEDQLCFFSRWNLQGAANWRVNLGKRPVLEVLHIIEHHDVYDSRGCHCNGKRTLPLTHPLPSVLRVTRLTELAIEHFLLFWISVTPVTACSRSTGTSK